MLPYGCGIDGDGFGVSFDDDDHHVFVETFEELWPAARRFTEARERQIAEVEEEIEATNTMLAACRAFKRARTDLDVAENEIAVHKRILARLEAIRDDLKRGMVAPPVTP